MFSGRGKTDLVEGTSRDGGEGGGGGNKTLLLMHSAAPYPKIAHAKPPTRDNSKSSAVGDLKNTIAVSASESINKVKPPTRRGVVSQYMNPDPGNMKFSIAATQGFFLAI
jgi:hypothetical protein